MPKSIVVHPEKVRQANVLESLPIPLNQYESDPTNEIKTYGAEKLKLVYSDMVLIREFETALNMIKTQGAYEGIEYDHKGPAHLSIGQEASAVGQCIHLDVEDYIFGSHRSHGEILAKCLSALRTLDEKTLSDTLAGYMNGRILSVVEKDHNGDIQSLATDYILFGTMAEIFAKDNGFNRGWGGSMHAFFAPFGSMPNNAIVGGSADIATGSALFKRINRKPGIVLANIGDASSACGPVWEAMMIAAMDQYRTLWPKEIGGAPPIMFNFFNNFYGMGGQPAGETMGFEVLARIGAGVNPEAMHAERVDGYNPLAVADAIKRKKEILLAGKGPVLLDVITYRLSGHSPSDASAYRSRDEITLWEESDCVTGFQDYLIKNKIATSNELTEIKDEAVSRIKKTLERASSSDIAPRLPMDSEAIGETMFSDGKKDKMDDREPEVLTPIAENPRVKANAKKSRSRDR